MMIKQFKILSVPFMSLFLLTVFMSGCADNNLNPFPGKIQITSRAQVNSGVSLGQYVLSNESAPQGNAMNLAYGTSTDGEPVITYWNGVPLNVISVGSSLYELTESIGGRCITISGSSVVIEACQGNPDQLFYLSAQNDGSFIIQSAAVANTCVSASGEFARVQSVACDNSVDQNWSFSGSTPLNLGVSPSPTPSVISSPTPTPSNSPLPAPSASVSSTPVGTILGQYSLFNQGATQGNAMNLAYGTSMDGEPVNTYWTGVPLNVVSMGNHLYELTESIGGRCVSLSGGSAVIEPCVGAATQLFSLFKQNDGSYTIQSSSVSTCLTANGSFSVVQSVACNGTANQNWNFSGSTPLNLGGLPSPIPSVTASPTTLPSTSPSPTPSPTVTPAPSASASSPAGSNLGQYSLANESVPQGNAMNLAYGTSVEGEPVITYWNAVPMNVISMGNSQYSFTESLGGRCITVSGLSLVIESCTGISSQLFSLQPQTDGSYFIQSANSLCLEASGGFVPVQVATCTGSAGQKWIFSGSSPLSLGTNPSPTPTPSVTTTPSPSVSPSPTSTSGNGLLLSVGLKKTVPSYSGAAMRIERLSDNAQTDIGFAVSGAVDTSAILSFLGSNSTLGYVVKLYDQSGNGNDVVQPNVNSAPTIMLSAPTSMVIGGSPFITARSVITSTATEQPQAGPGYWNLPTGLTVNAQGTSAVLAYSPDFSGGEGFEEFNIGNSTSNNFDLIRNSSGYFGLVQDGNAWLNYASGFYARQQPTVLALVTSTSAAPELYIDSVAHVGISNIGSSTLTGGTLLGGPISSNATFANFLAFELYSSTLSSTQVASVSATLIPRTSPTVNLVADGDSITEGHCASYGRAALRYAEEAFSTPVDITNIALGGTTTSNPLTNISNPSVSNSRVSHLYQSTYAKNIYYLAIGTNDIHVTNATGSATWSNVQSILADAKTLGFKTVVATILHEAGETQAQGLEVDHYNAFLRAADGGALVDAVVDYEANMNLQAPLFGQAYSCDGTHPNDAGYAVMGQILAPILHSLAGN